MMSEVQEAHPEAAAILAGAGWAPHPEWQTYTRDTRIAGITPDQTSLNVKNWAQIQPGDPRHSANTPDTAEEAAAWLVAWHVSRTAVLTTEATLEPPLAPPVEAEENPAHEGDGETGAAPQAGALDEGADQGDLGFVASDLASDEGGGDAPFDVLDADFTEDPLLEFGSEVLDEHPEEHASGAFIFGDNLDQKRTAAIGLVMQAALARMPAWSDTDTARLSELRNFAMGVSEGRWNDDPGSRQWLEELETRLRRRSQIVSHRDGLVEHLNSASREEIEAFDPEAGWPE